MPGNGPCLGDQGLVAWPGLSLKEPVACPGPVEGWPCLGDQGLVARPVLGVEDRARWDLGGNEEH